MLLKTSCTNEDVLYGISVTVPSTTPLIWIGVPTFKLCSVAVVTVIRCVGTTPLPDWILVIWIGSAAKAPTISNSGLLGEKPSGFNGNLSAGGITLVAAASLNAFDNLS